jgi:hypothetical protein
VVGRRRLDLREGDAAAEHEEAGQRRDVADAVERQQLLGDELKAAHDAQQAQQAKRAQRLQRCRCERRREDQHRQRQRVLAHPRAPVARKQHDRHELEQEREPDRPVADHRDAVPGGAQRPLLEHQIGDHEQRGKRQRNTQARIDRRGRRAAKPHRYLFGSPGSLL